MRDRNIWAANANGQPQRQLTAFSKSPETSNVSQYLDLEVDLTWDPMSDRIMFSQGEATEDSV